MWTHPRTSSALPLISPMASRTLAGLSTVLAATANVSEALLALSRDISNLDRNASVVLFTHDARRDVLCERMMPAGDTTKTIKIEISIDHLPTAVRRTIATGRQFADLGGESGDYQKLLGVGASPEAGVLLLRGLLVDNQLSAVFALSEPKRVFGQRLSDKVGPAIDLFALAFSRLADRRARDEAVQRLEELTRALNEEHARTVDDLQRKLADAQAALSGTAHGDTERVKQLKRAVEVAAVEARATAQRLSAVEEQVRVAVTTLEKAHVQLHVQGEALEQQGNLIYRVERMLREAIAGENSRKVIEDVLEIVTSRAEHASSL